MKIRSNYVSNSSSSSYVIGVASFKIENEDKVKSLIDSFPRFVKDQVEIVKDNNCYVKETAFDENEVSIFIPNDHYAIKFYDYINAETDEYGEIISEAEEEDFDQNIIGLIHNEENLFDAIEYTFGEGYNG